MPDRRVVRNGLVNQIFNEAGVRKIKTGVYPQRQNLGIGHHGMASHVAEIHGSGELTDHCHMRSRRGVEVEEDRQPHACKQPGLNTIHPGQEDRGDHSGKVGKRILPSSFECAKVY